MNVAQSVFLTEAEVHYRSTNPFAQALMSGGSKYSLLFTFLSNSYFKWSLETFPEPYFCVATVYKPL
jgi:hypothetical protein